MARLSLSFVSYIYLKVVTSNAILTKIHSTKRHLILHARPVSRLLPKVLKSTYRKKRIKYHVQSSVGFRSLQDVMVSILLCFHEIKWYVSSVAKRNKKNRVSRKLFRLYRTLKKRLHVFWKTKKLKLMRPGHISILSRYIRSLNLVRWGSFLILKPNVRNYYRFMVFRGLCHLFLRIFSNFIISLKMVSKSKKFFYRLKRKLCNKWWIVALYTSLYSTRYKDLFLFYFVSMKRKLAVAVNNRVKNKLVPTETFIDFFGMKFFGASLFNLYIRLFFVGEERHLLMKRFLYFYSFFYNKLTSSIDGQFFSFLFRKFTMKLAFSSKISVLESLLYSICSLLKMYTGSLGNAVLLNAITSARFVLTRTFIFLSGRGHVVPTPNTLDKQYKVSIRNICTFMKKRYYIRDIFKRSCLQGRYVGRRVPFYKRLTKLCKLLLRTQSFFLLTFKKYRGLRFTKSDVFGFLKKNVYMFLLQRTYVQYRWR